MKSKPPNVSGQMLHFYINKRIERNENFMNETHASPPKSVFASKKTDAIYRDDTWCTKLVDLNDFGPENFEGNTCISVIINTFCKFRCTEALQSKIAQTRKRSFENMLNFSLRKPNLIETVDGKKYAVKTFSEFLDKCISKKI